MMAPNQKQSSGPSKGEQMYSHGGLVLTKKLVAATTKMILKNVILTKTYQIQKRTYCIIYLNEILEQEN